MTEKRYAASNDLIFRLLQPFRRSLDEAMRTMDRDMDQERTEKIEEYKQTASVHTQSGLHHRAHGSHCGPGTRKLSHPIQDTLGHDPTLLSTHTSMTNGYPLESRAITSGSPYNEADPLTAAKVHQSGMDISHGPSDSPDTMVMPEPKEWRLSEKMVKSGHLKIYPRDSETLGPVLGGKTAESNFSGTLESEKSRPLSEKIERIPLESTPALKGNVLKDTTPREWQDKLSMGRSSIRGKTIQPVVYRAEADLGRSVSYRAQPTMASGSGNIDPARQAGETMAGEPTAGLLPEQGRLSSQPVRTSRLTPEIRRASDRVAAGIEPVLEQAYAVTRHSFRTKIESEAQKADFDTVNRVNNTFNVNVSMAGDNGLTLNHREALEDALVDILRTAARRQGLEV